ncbi:MAG: hypothetical protein E7252_02900 [Lachnospira sp.]|nr:hypothetical protein [Lachnospira sp.]
MELKKSYRGLVLWIAGFTGAMFLAGLLPLKGDIITLVVSNIMTFEVAILAGIIYVTEKIFWYNGISYEEAVEVGSARRKAYAFKYFASFGIFALVFLGISVILYVLNVPVWVSLILLTVGIVGVAISTVRFKL